MSRALFLLALLLAASAAQGADDVHSYVDKYARPFTLPGDAAQLCSDESQAVVNGLVSQGKTREEGIATVNRMVQSMNAQSSIQWYQNIYASAKSERTEPSAAFAVCYLKVKILKDYLSPGDPRPDSLPGFGQRATLLAARGQYRRTGVDTWQYVSPLDVARGLSEYSLADVQGQVRRRTGREYPVKEAIAACEPQLEAADRARLKAWEQELPELEVRVRGAAGKPDELRRAQRDLAHREIEVRGMREDGRYSRDSFFDPSKIAIEALTPAKAIREEDLPRWQKDLSDPSEDKRVFAAANICLINFRLAQQPGAKPAAKQKKSAS